MAGTPITVCQQVRKSAGPEQDQSVIAVERGIPAPLHWLSNPQPLTPGEYHAILEQALAGELAA